MTAVTAEDRAVCAAALSAVRASTPRVHCITNTVVQNFTANALLAFGAVPSMTSNPQEVADFVAGADALLVNLGTVDAERHEAVPLAIEAARDRGIPVVLDPVFVDRSPGRARFGRTLLAHEPAIVRANEREWGALLADKADNRGETATRVALALRAGNTVAVVSGPRDRIVLAGRTATLSGGHTLMSKVTGVGCVQSAVMGALAAVAATPFHAALTGVLAFALCGERAGAAASGPGTFEVALLDALYGLAPEDLMEHKP